jgi:hypothetical protein
MTKFSPLYRVPGAAQHEVMRCRPGTYSHDSLRHGSRICAAPLRDAARAGREDSRHD